MAGERGEYRGAGRRSKGGRGRRQRPAKQRLLCCPWEKRGRAQAEDCGVHAENERLDAGGRLGAAAQSRVENESGGAKGVLGRNEKNDAASGWQAGSSWVCWVNAKCRGGRPRCVYITRRACVTPMRRGRLPGLAWAAHRPRSAPEDPSTTRSSKDAMTLTPCCVLAMMSCRGRGGVAAASLSGGLQQCGAAGSPARAALPTAGAPL